MKDINRIIARQNRSKRTKRIVLAVIGLIIVLAIVIPVAVVISNRHSSKGLVSSVLVPLYIYPSQGAWDPLFNAITRHSKLNFTIIINPDSGPGATKFPNDDFNSQILRLNGYANVRTIGYVRTNYSARAISDVVADIAAYSGWADATTNQSLAMKGIFFDEAPSQYSPATNNYLQNINQAVDNASGIIGEKLIVHNPGTIPDPNLENDRTDLTVVFEGPYSEYTSREPDLKALSNNRSKYSYIVHSVPSGSTKSLGGIVDNASQRASSLFYTYLTENYYESFGNRFGDFIGVVSTK